MAGNSTVYDVSIRYALDDRASQALERLGATAEKTEKSVGGLKEGLKTIAEVFLAREAFHKGKELFVDINSEFEQMKIRMGGIIGAGLHISFDKAAESSDKLVESWKQFSKTTTLTTKEITDFGAGISVGVIQSGGSVDELDKMVKKGSQVMQILGSAHPGGMAYSITELNEALMGNVSNRQQSNMALLSPVLARHKKDFSDFRRMTGDERRAMVMEAFDDPAWQGAIGKMKNSWMGVTSTLKDNIELTAAGIGEKLFSGLKVYVKGINEWIETHPKQIEEFGQKFSNALIKGFEMVKDVFSFIIEHKDVLVKLAEMWVIGKVAGGLGSGIGGSLGGGKGLAGLGTTLGAFSGGGFWSTQKSALAGGGPGLGGVMSGAMIGLAIDQFANSAKDSSSALSHFKTGLTMATSALATLPGPLGLIGVALTGAIFAINAYSDWLDKRQEEEIKTLADWSSVQQLTQDTYKRSRDLSSMDNDPNTYWKTKMLREADKLNPTIDKFREIGVDVSKSYEENLKIVGDYVNAHAKAEASYNSGTFGGSLASYDEKSALLVFDELRELFTHLNEEVVKRLGGNFPNSPPDVTNAKKQDKPNVNIHIHKIEVPAADPDRFVHQLVRKFEYVVRNPTQADSALRGGF